MYGFLKHQANHRDVTLGRLIKKLPLWSVRAKFFRPSIPPFERENLGLPFTLNLIILDPLELIYAIYQLMHVLSRFHGERFPQVRIYRKPHFYILKTPINLPIPIGIGF